MTRPRSMYEKIWDVHVVVARDDGTALLFIVRHLYQEGSRNSFHLLRAKGRTVRRPELTFGCAAHLMPTKDQAAGVTGIQSPEAWAMGTGLDDVAPTPQYEVQPSAFEEGWRTQTPWSIPGARVEGTASRRFPDGRRAATAQGRT